MKTLLLTIIMGLSLTANAQEFESVDPAELRPIIPLTIMSGVYLLLLDEDEEMVSAPAPDTGEGTCSVIIDGVLYFYWCDTNEPLPEFGNE